MSELSLRDFEAAITEREPAPLATAERAAVAALLRFDDPDGTPDVLLMRRAEHERDRWSGHVSLPGGREEAIDPNLLTTAVRETREEVGVDLSSSARLLGALDPIRAVARGVPTSISIAPFAFVETEPCEITLNHEAVRAFWLPLGRAASGELDGVHHYRMGDAVLELPCWRYDGELVWGLTHRILGSMIDLVSASARRGR